MEAARIIRTASESRLARSTDALTDMLKAKTKTPLDMRARVYIPVLTMAISP